MKSTYVRSMLAACLFITAAAHAYEENIGVAETAEPTPQALEKTNTIAAALTDIAPEGWAPTGEVERYTFENLYDKINGRSELYFSYNFQGMVWLSMTPEGDPSKYIDIFLYDMATPAGAFGPFSVERWPGNETVDLARQAYRADGHLFAWHGRYYLVLQGSSEDDEIQKPLLATAKKILAKLKDTGEPLWGLEARPKENRIEDTVQYFMVDANGLEFLTNTFTARYTKGDETITLFLSKQESEAAAQKIAEQYTEYFQEYGDKIETDEETGITTADLGGGYFDGFVQKGHYIGGTVSTNSRAQAHSEIAKLMNPLGAS